MLLNEWKNHTTSTTLQLHKIGDNYTCFLIQPGMNPVPKYFKTYNWALKHARRLAENMKLDEE